MLTKEQVINSLKEMPDKFSIDDLMDKLILLQKIEIGLEQSKKRRGLYGRRSKRNA
jgi:hypothetical protein